MYMHAYLLNMKTDTFIIHTVIPKLNMVIIILRKQIFEYNPNKFHLIDRASTNVSLIGIGTSNSSIKIQPQIECKSSNT